MNAYLLVHSEKADVSLSIAAGATGDIPAHPDQPNNMASVGKLFTSVIIAKLYEEGKLKFNDRISDYLDREFTKDIEIRHLLNQTSGLDDNFMPLLERLLNEGKLDITPREAEMAGSIYYPRPNLTVGKGSGLKKLVFAMVNQ
ncbi:MAG: serine hydrolase domain-containing protein [Bacillota bacterium]